MWRQLSGLKTGRFSDRIMIERLRWRFRVGILMALALTAMLASPFMAVASTASGDFIVKDEPMGRMTMMAPFAIVELANGDDIMFTEMSGERGGVEGVLVSELRSHGRASSRSIDGLRDANPLELFQAVAEPGRETPEILTELYSVRMDNGDQGWARDIIIATNPTYNPTCPGYGVTEWSDDMDYYSGIFNDDDPFESTWDGPDAKPAHWSWNGGNGQPGNQNYDLHGQANDTTAFFASVLYCYEDHENNYTYNGQYVGNYVQTFFRTAGHQNWIMSQSIQVENPGDIVDHTYAPANRFNPGAAKFDFHLDILQAKPADLFHIGATWVYGGPTDVKLGW